MCSMMTNTIPVKLRWRGKLRYRNQRSSVILLMSHFDFAQACKQTDRNSHRSDDNITDHMLCWRPSRGIRRCWDAEARPSSRRRKLTERGQKAAQALWANLTPEERSVEMKRRAEVRERNRAAKAKASQKRKPKSPNSR